MKVLCVFLLLITTQAQASDHKICTVMWTTFDNLNPSTPAVRQTEKALREKGYVIARAGNYFEFIKTPLYSPGIIYSLSISNFLGMMGKDDCHILKGDGLFGRDKLYCNYKFSLYMLSPEGLEISLFNIDEALEGVSVSRSNRENFYESINRQLLEIPSCK